MIKCILLSIFMVGTTVHAQEAYLPVKKEILDIWIVEAQEANEIDASQLENLEDEYNELITKPESPNRVFDYGRILTIMLQPGLTMAAEKELSGAGQKIVDEAERAYRTAVSACECHGRANIMLGLLYNQQGKYGISESYLEKGLELNEGGSDWMIAANQYLLAGAYTNNMTEEKYLKVYQLFKEYAETATKDVSYYQKMAGLYVSYYE
ncbi:hypothetical protein I2486_03695 [Cellulophaga sp. E16_2]|uniref:hypothetical protein n=1 Tax=Cellulophaga sp. E16_2 TaxID=2789297 RepID=UPI001A92D017|nr:hypothetical protein [Cellulophaga sp. E16_2]MBO0590502.1 hypothetical protein [Cellulophaga sp. E16_2]